MHHLTTGRPTSHSANVSRLRWPTRRRVKALYAGSNTERATITALRESTNKIITAIRGSWPEFPTPEDVHRDDGELLGRLIPTSGGWQATTPFGAPLGDVTSHEEALDTAHRGYQLTNARLETGVLAVDLDRRRCRREGHPHLEVAALDLTAQPIPAPAPTTPSSPG